MKKRLLRVAAVLLVAAIPAYVWLFLESGTPSHPFQLDLNQLRALGNSVAGDKPSSIRVEKVTSFDGVPMMGVVANSAWQTTSLSVYAYQVVSPQSTGVIDTAMVDATSQNYDAQALRRVQQAMNSAAFVVITHEHYDHIGGLTTHPQLAKVLPHTLLTSRQLAHPEKMNPTKFVEGALTGYQPLDYEGARAIAPGVVLVSSPGHTPGSQLVFVQQADGQEFLFVGDVAWTFANIDTMKERARLVTLMMGEDRDLVLAQLAALHTLHTQAPALHIVPGHDASVIDALVASKALIATFEAR
jgi:glyoxylase-like metal-dependent hydrolase (beta-lactamase superfamily II)